MSPFSGDSVVWLFIDHCANKVPACYVMLYLYWTTKILKCVKNKNKQLWCLENSSRRWKAVLSPGQCWGFSRLLARLTHEPAFAQLPQRAGGRGPCPVSAPDLLGKQKQKAAWFYHWLPCNRSTTCLLTTKNPPKMEQSAAGSMLWRHMKCRVLMAGLKC